MPCDRLRTMIDTVKVRKLFLGASTWIPGALTLRKALLPPLTNEVSSRSCYSVWLRHLVAIQQAGVSLQPRVVAEIGPGGSLGVGVAALLSGASRYLAFDVSMDAETTAATVEEI